MATVSITTPCLLKRALSLLAIPLIFACTAAPDPIQRLSSYSGALKLPLQEKISLGSEALLDWQHRINLNFGQDTRPSKASAGNPLVAEVYRMVAGLPVEIRDLAARHLVALYLLENDFGTGTTEAVQDDQGRWRYSYIALNLTALTRDANAWGSWKETSAFRPEAGHEIRMVLETPEQDSKEAAIRFIFLHELGHALGLALGAHGWWDAETTPATTRDSPFLKLSWLYSKEGKMASRWSQQYPDFSKLDYYSFDKAKLPISTANRIYRDLANTDFPTLYGTTNIFDDFAEAFAVYVHTKILGRPYRVEVYRKGKRRFVFRSCIDTGACPAKVAALKSVLGF